MKGKLLKVWGMYDFNDQGKQERAVVATRTKAEAVRLFNVSLYHFNNYAAQTFNEFECKVALENPGKKIFVGG